MEITQEALEANNVAITIQLAPEDYQPGVEKGIRQYARKANLPGFRKGKVPKGVIKKMFGRQILADELTRLVKENLSKYLKEQQFQILGDPIPANDHAPGLDVYAEKTYDFTYEIGLEPEFELSVLNPKTKVTRYEVTVDDKLLDEEIGRLQKRFGDNIETDKPTEEDLVQVEFIELDETGQLRESGVRTESTFPVDSLRPKKLMKQVLDMAKGDSLEINLFKAFDQDRETIGRLRLNLEGEALDKVGENFRMKIIAFRHFTEAPLEQALFDKVYGEGQVKSEEEFRNQIREELTSMLANESEVLLNSDIVKLLIDTTEMQIPEGFMKRWLKETSEQPLDDTNLENEFEPFIRNLKWSLIVNKIVKEQGIDITREELEGRTKELLKLQYGFKDDTEEAKNQLDQIAHSLMHNEEHVNRTYKNLRDARLFEYLKQTLTIKTKKVSYKQFKEINES